MSRPAPSPPLDSLKALSSRPSAAPSERLRTALALLAEEVRQRVERHPAGHLLAGRGDALDLQLSLPTALREGRLEEVESEVSAVLQSAIDGLLAHQALFEPGRVFCLRCGSAHCVHSAPTGGRQVFTGYGPSGLPRFVDLGEWLLARRDPRVDLLYRDTPQLLTVTATGAELTAGLIPHFRQREDGYRLHGQVAAGWFVAPARSGPARPIAVSFQILSSRRPGGRRRFGLNVLGTGPEGEPLEQLFDRRGFPWSDPVRWAQGVLSGLERQGTARESKETAAHTERRLDGLLQALARRLEKDWRGKDRRTRHAEERHGQGDRPTRMALADLARSAPEGLLFDVRRKTLVVLGERGRAHVFNLSGKLVTSLRTQPAAVEKRRERGLWRPATPEEVERVRSHMDARTGGDEEAPA